MVLHEWNVCWRETSVVLTLHDDAEMWLRVRSRSVIESCVAFCGRALDPVAVAVASVKAPVGMTHMAVHALVVQPGMIKMEAAPAAAAMTAAAMAAGSLALAVAVAPVDSVATVKPAVASAAPTTAAVRAPAPATAAALVPATAVAVPRQVSSELVEVTVSVLPLSSAPAPPAHA